jgi:hypothetical protein
MSGRKTLAWETAIRDLLRTFEMAAAILEFWYQPSACRVFASTDREGQMALMKSSSHPIVPASGTHWSMSSADGLRIDVSSTAGGKVFADFFAGYDRAFILPDEKEDEEGLRACLALNHGTAYERVSARFGPFREVILTAREDGQPVGGANLISFPLPSRSGDTDSSIISTNLNYIYIDAAFRRRGYFRRLVAALDTVVRCLFESGSAEAAPRRHLVFFELNDPFRLSEESSERDTGHSGLDQFARVGIWARLGARIVDFPYVQPALSEDQAPDGSLGYGVLGAAGTALGACVLHDHLERFFGISVFKGKEPLDDPAAKEQLIELRKHCASNQAIPLLDPKGCTASDAPKFSSLRECLRSSSSAG